MVHFYELDGHNILFFDYNYLSKIKTIHARHTCREIVNYTLYQHHYLCR
jgi:hypothetical protein